jgi:hypothetical protein
MTDLSHWDFAEEFHSFEAAALILGYEPREAEDFQGRINIVVDRMDLHFRSAIRTAFDEPVLLHERHTDAKPMQVGIGIHNLHSVELLRQLERRASHGEVAVFSRSHPNSRAISIKEQKFSRHEISLWLDATGFKSKYPFKLDSSQPALVAPSLPELDPSDLPRELDAANMAFRAYTNQYGASTATPKQWLLEWLQKSYPDFKWEQIQRIATVANPDKSTGRKKIAKE